MDAPLLIGIDGGGSGCRARLCDGSGRVLGEGSAGPANIRLGASAFVEILAACRAAAWAAGLSDADLVQADAGLGLAGLIDPADQAKLATWDHPFRSITADNDAYTALLGAHGGGDGAILIVGTGSCGVARMDGRRWNVGGWGFHISDDGGGAVLGREAIRRALWVSDGLAPASPLAEAILAGFGHRPATIVDWAAGARAADYAAVAPLVFEHAGARDALAVALVQDAAAAVARMLGRLLELGAARLSLLGGLAGPIAPWLPPPLRQALAPPQGDALDGALLLAGQAEAARRDDLPRVPG